MKSNPFLILILILALIGVSGCIDTDSNHNISSDNLTREELKKIEGSEAWNQSVKNFENNWLPHEYYSGANLTLNFVNITDAGGNNTYLKVLAKVTRNYNGEQIEETWSGSWVKKGPIWEPSDDFRKLYLKNKKTGKISYLIPIK